MEESKAWIAVGIFVTAFTLSEFSVFLTGLLFINILLDLRKDDELYKLKKKQ